MENDKPLYFAAKEAKDVVTELEARSEAWYNTLKSNQYIDKIKRSWAAYHNAKLNEGTDGHEISFSGEQGELVNIAVNQFRNIAQHMHVITTSNRPMIQARATNTDYKSLTQTKLANGLLDYYMREKKLEHYLKRAVEFAIVMASGWVKMGWNATSGEAYDFNEELQTEVHDGDVEFYNLSPLDVVVDTYKENSDFDWVICRTYKNKYDLIAKYPELEDAIRAVKTKSELEHYNFGILHGTDKTDEVPLYEFYHKRTESMPEGRFILYLSPDAILDDVPLPYRSIPVFRIAPSDVLGTPFGYTPMFDILPIQSALDSLYSTILTNQHSFGVQNVMVPRGSDILAQQLAGGLNIIEYNPTAGKPESLNLTNTPAEIFKFIETLERVAETISGVNSVARGNPEASLRSGNALALVQSMALQFLSGLQASYVELIENVGSALINMLKDFASTPRIAAIVGKNNRTENLQFTGGDLSSISRVQVELGNALARSTAGRIQMADNLLQYQLLSNPQQYITLLNTGNLDTVTEDSQKEQFLIKRENEDLVDGSPVIALAWDPHREHILEHKAVLADPELRKDPDLVTRVIAHIDEHIKLLTETDPAKLALFGQQALQPAAPLGAPPGEPPAPGEEALPPEGAPESVQGPGMEEPIKIPSAPNVPAELLPNPSIEPRAE